MNEQKTQASWEKFLNPESLRGNLICLSLFICAYELFKESIVDRPKTFYMDGFDQNGVVISDDYKTEVLSLHQRPLTASMLWFLKMGAIDEGDLNIYHALREYRNQIAHEMHRFVVDSGRDLEVEKFGQLVDVLNKIEKWWFLNFEAAVNPDALPDGADPDDVVSGSIVTLQLMLDIALGNEPEEGFFHNAYKSAQKPHT